MRGTIHEGYDQLGVRSMRVAVDEGFTHEGYNQ